MLRRMLPMLAVVALGLLAFTAGLIALQRTFAVERDTANVALRRQREALEQYAGTALRDSLHRGLENARHDIDRGRDDALAPGDGLLLVEDGKQVLPRLDQPAPGNETPATNLYEAARTNSLDDADDSPVGEQVALVAALEASTLRNDRPRIESGFRALLAHRARFVAPPENDVPLMVGLIDFFVGHASADERLLAGLLHDGFADRRVGNVEGLQSTLLRGRSRFTQPDFDFLAGRVLALSKRYGVVHDEFEARLHDAPEQLAQIGSTQLPALIDDWYEEQDGHNAVRGVRVELPRFISKVHSEMALRGLINADDEIAVSREDGGVLPLPSLTPAVVSPRWAIESNHIERRFQFKTGLIAFTGLLGLGLVTLLLLEQGRKQRYLQLKSDFLATVSHELRTPLASLRVMTETLEQRVEGIAGMRDYPARMLGDIDQLGFLVENILSFNRLDKGRWAPRLGEVPLSEAVAAVRTELAAFTKRPVHLTVEGFDGLSVEADADMLRLLFANLARNACQYNARETVELKLSAARTDRLRVRIEDNGVGIPEGEREKIFDEFYRSAASPPTRGSGLGLALCRKVMRLHHGSIQVVDSGPQGTTFELTFS